MEKKTIDDIRNLALHEPVVKAYMQMHYVGDLTLEEALIGMVCALREKSETFKNEAVKNLQNRVI